MPRSRLILAVLPLGIALSPHGAESAPAGVHLVASGSSAIHFTVDVPPHLGLTPVAGVADAPDGVRLVIDGYELVAEHGAPELPQRIVMVAVPPSGEVRLRARGEDARTIENVDLSPPAWAERGKEAEPPVYPRSAEAYAAATPVAPARARVLEVSWMRNQRVARVALWPAEYSPATRRLTLWRTLDVELEVEPAAETTTPAERVDPFEGLYHAVLVNPEQGERWRRPDPGAGAIGSEGTARAAVIPDQSVFTGRPWIKIAITKTGFYKVDFGQLRTLPPFSTAGAVPVDSLRLYSWPGLPYLAESDSCDDCDYREVAIGISESGTGNGQFDVNGDSFYFFGLGPSDWNDLYQPAAPETLFTNNPYETRSFYYLTVSTAENPVPGRFQRILTATGTPTGGGTQDSTFQSRSHFEVDTPTEYFPDAPPIGSTLFWEKWFWRSLSSTTTFFSLADAPGADTTQNGRLRMRLWGLAAVDTCFSRVRRPHHEVQWSWNAAPLRYEAWNSSTAYTVDAPIPLRTAGNTLNISLFPGTPPFPCFTRAAIAWFDLFYARRFVPQGDELTFSSRDVAGDFVYRIGPFTSATPPRVFDLTDSFEPIEVLGLVYEPLAAGGYRLTFEAAQSRRRTFRVIPPTSITAVPSASITVPPPTSLESRSLRSTSRGADYVVIYYDDFKTAADSLDLWRQAHNGMQTTAVPVSAIYDQFSGGRIDPAAIRNFLRAAFYNWNPRPAYVTLLGDASFDFKNYKGRAGAGQPGTLVPSYENGFDSGVDRQFATDDWLLNLDRGRVVDFLGGRVPANDAASALSFVRDKVLFYERSTPVEEYRNRVMLIADDNEQGARDDPLKWTHMSQTSTLDSLAIPSHMDRVYVYLHTYPDGAGETKPGAKDDIKKNINGPGIAIMNFIGHGSPFQLTDEGVLLDTDVGSFINAQRLPLFIAASCDIGKYNDPTVLSLGERMLLRNGGGAIGVISATELAFSYQNATLDTLLFRSLFRRDPTPGSPTYGQYYVPISRALVEGKTTSANSQKYQLMGDAATRLDVPHLWMETSLWDTAGTDSSSTIHQGQTLLLKGRLLDRPGGGQVPFEGVASILVEDSAPLQLTPPCTLPNVGTCYQQYYYYRAGPIFQGNVAVRQGAFEIRFVVPLEARLGTHGRVRAYVAGRQVGTAFDDDGAGSRPLVVATGAAVSNDHSGPTITLSFAGGSTIVSPTAVLQALISDPSGILTTGHTPQNGIVVTVDANTTNRVDITPSFRYAADSYQSGTASFALPNLPAGPHRIRISAADNLAAGLHAGEHRSFAEIDFEVRAVPPLHIARAYLFPNPTSSSGGRRGGLFVVDSQGDSLNVLVRIYTVSGKMIRSLSQFGGLGQVQIPWDGLDAEGQVLGNGTYVFKVHANNREADGSSSSHEHDVTEGKFVIVNR